MSAFICSDNHINAIVTYAHKAGILTKHTRQGAADSLLFENTRSVNYRYGEKEVNTITYLEYVPIITSLEIIKLCHCLDYQSCETDDWKRTDAYGLLKDIEAAAIRNMLGYDEAEWSLS